MRKKQKSKLNVVLGNPWVLLGIAVVAAAGLSYAIYKVLDTRDAALRRAQQAGAGPNPVATAGVIVPVRDVAAGTPVSAASFAARDIPVDLVYDDMVPVGEFDAVMKKPLLHAMKQGRPLRRGDIDGLAAKDFSDLLTPGMRALTIRTDDVDSTAGMVRPGNRIDLYLAGETKLAGPWADPSKVVRLLFANLRVLATGRDVRTAQDGDLLAQDAAGDGASGNYHTITLEVTPAEARRIVLAQAGGTLRTLLRNSRDEGKEAEGTQIVAQPDAMPNAAERARAIEYIVGGQQNPISTLPMPEPARQTPPAPAVASSAPSSFTEAQQKRLAQLADAFEKPKKSE
ncbi:Flp pilus assembly protein CpaB [Trinickia mobilis]|uniref:Flp pilus assembly protein CpaB n=1 Tax=Trinickia mobilis TaxID=2816356 RepID=UPI001A8DE6BD|nr:Flp pilus assembly protein CpaB [Trinickia mobilis]